LDTKDHLSFKFISILIINSDEDDDNDDYDEPKTRIPLNVNRNNKEMNFLPFEEQSSDSSDEDEDDNSNFILKNKKQQLVQDIDVQVKKPLLNNSDFDQKNFTPLTNITFSSIKEVINESLNNLEDNYKVHKVEHDRNVELLDLNIKEMNDLIKKKPFFNEQYTFFQEMEGYLIDFIDCYSEKMIDIENAENKWFSTFKQMSDKIINQRKEDIQDENIECSVSANKKPIDTLHQRRIDARNERRSKKQKNLNKLEANDIGNDNDDDDDYDEEEIKFFKIKTSNLINLETILLKF
jgi:hypothetical protein